MVAGEELKARYKLHTHVKPDFSFRKELCFSVIAVASAEIELNSDIHFKIGTNFFIFHLKNSFDGNKHSKYVSFVNF